MSNTNKNKNKVKFGLKNVHYAIINESGEFGTVKKIPGAVNISMEAKGEANEFFADDNLYFGDNTNQGYEGTLEVAVVPDDFNVDVFGFTIDNKGVLIENKDASTKSIALLFEINGDANKTRHLLYNVSVKRTGLASSTETASKDIKAESLSIKVTADLKTGNIRARSSKGDQAYDNWFNAVYKTGV